VSFWRHDYFWPTVLILLGIYFLLRNLGLIDWLNGNVVWPVILILLGLWLILRRARA
jgi:hypothetical protein